MSVVQASNRYALRRSVTQFVINGWTKLEVPIVHDTDCAYMERVRRACLDGGSPHLIPVVLDRHPNIGPLNRQFDLLLVLFERAAPNGVFLESSPITFCRCTYEKVGR